MNVALTNIQIGTSGTFYKLRDNNKQLTKTILNDQLKECLKGKNALYKDILKSESIDGVNISYSLIVFSYESVPTFLHDTELKENLYGYLLIFDYLPQNGQNHYVVIQKKGANLIDSLKERIVKLEDNLLQNAFIETDSAFEKLSMRNLDASEYAMRSRMVEASNLKNTFSGFGMNKYALRSFRMLNNDGECSISLNTSHIGLSGSKADVMTYLKWCKSFCDKLESYRGGNDNYLSLFAFRTNYSKEKDNLIPIAILFHLDYLQESLNQEYVECFVINKKGVEIPFDVIRFINRYGLTKGCITLMPTANPDEYIADFGIVVVKGNNGVALKNSKFLRRIYIRERGETTKKYLTTWLNSNACYNIYFEDSTFAYIAGSLYHDNALLGNIDNFLSVFKGDADLKHVSSEKGEPSATSTNFDIHCTFGWVESKFKNASDYLVCDDLGGEWADHIGITGQNVDFYISKYHKSTYSASAFQEVVGQAQKNIGNLAPQRYVLDRNLAIWNNAYVLNSVHTQIQRLRKGASVESLIEAWDKAVKSTNFTGTINLIVNFISKSQLTYWLNRLRNGESFREKQQTIQLLWLLSSLINSCREVGARIYIYCKP